MRNAPRALAASVLGLGLLWPTGADAGEPSGDGEFQVIVLRGAGVARVTGDASGALREEILREDPRPARAEPRAQPRDEPIVIVVSGAPANPGPHFFVGDVFFPSDRFHPKRPRPSRHVFPSPGPGPAFYHGRARGHTRSP